MESDHHIAGPAVECVDHDHLHTASLDIIEQFFEGWSLGYLFSSGAALVVFVENRIRQTA
ncbi:MAG TPA: hypothetical protein VFV38_39120 [Ktedonobacteraceae bacterium]|nr:hypothetical protein [Ktedonobacteraceae bacterium]